MVVEGSHDLARLIDLADVVLCDVHPSKLRALNIPTTVEAFDETRSQPGVLVVVTDLGLDGPHAEYAMTDITTWAAGGLGYVTRRPVPDEDEFGYSPVLAPARQPEVLGGIAASTAAMAGIRLRRQVGKSVVAEVSRQEVIAAMLHGVVPTYIWSSAVVGVPTSPRAAVGMLLPAADGQIYIRTVEENQWTSLLAWMGDPEWSKEPWLADPAQRMANWARIAPLVSEWTMQYSREWLYTEGQRRRVPIALPRTLNDVLSSEQLHARDVWEKVDVSGGTGVVPRIPMIYDHGLDPSMPIDTDELEARWSR
jgi:crotonobetainyl-CoA:carnitine CoA-transferase CaiB-like acyl-CoA transferase